MKTLKELSEELHVSEQALRSWCRKNGVPKTKATKATKPTYLIDFDTEISLKNHYSSETIESNETKPTKPKETNESNHVSHVSQEVEKLTAQNDELRAELILAQHNNDVLTIKEAANDELIASLRVQLDDNKAIISALTAQLDTKDKQIARLEDNLERVTTALQAAQALHGMEKKQAVIDTALSPTQAPSVSKHERSTKKTPRPELQRTKPTPTEKRKRSLSERLRKFFSWFHKPKSKFNVEKLLVYC